MRRDEKMAIITLLVVVLAYFLSMGIAYLFTLAYRFVYAMVGAGVVCLQF